MAEVTVKHSKANIYEFFFSNKKRATYSNLGISIVLVIVFLVFALRPTILTIGSIKTKIKDYEVLNKKAEAKISASKLLQDQMNLTSDESANGLKDQIEFINKTFQYNYSLKSIYTNVVQRAKASNVAIRSLVPEFPGQQVAISSFDNSSESPSDTSYFLNISVEGRDMASVENFIKTLEGYENFPLISRLNSASIVDEAESAKISEDPTSLKLNTHVVVGSVQLIVYLDKSRYEEPVVPVN
jgi:hypothetical protein